MLLQPEEVERQQEAGAAQGRKKPARAEGCGEGSHPKALLAFMGKLGLGSQRLGARLGRCTSLMKAALPQIQAHVPSRTLMFMHCKAACIFILKTYIDTHLCSHACVCARTHINS